MTRAGLEILEPVRLKALSEERAGEAWLAGLADTVRGLAGAWGLSVGRTLAGGTKAFVAEVTTAHGRAAVLNPTYTGPTKW
jgi:streptomycin 6-kinase